ncbi:MAG TPA: GTPase, partial [Fimbriimonadaceae bacterium]|nr:GTPase [Fimbriimonadaceae bacterium]
RAIVTEVPGTTRDTVEEGLSIDGQLYRLIDTAGIRDTADVVESMGVQRSRDAADNADIVIYLYDASVGWQQADDELIGTLPKRTVAFANKSDLTPTWTKGIPISCKTGEGIEQVTELMLRLTSDRAMGAGLINRRHVPLLDEARLALHRVISSLSGGEPTDIASVDLQIAIRALGEITGESTSPDVIERIFHDFCIGK